MRIHRIFLFLCLSLISFHAENIRGSGLDLSLFYGSRYIYLGGQQIAIATDAYAAFYNPAGLAFSEGNGFALNSTNLFYQFEAPIGGNDLRKRSESSIAPLFYLGANYRWKERLSFGFALFPTSLQGAKFTDIDFGGGLSGKTLGTRLVRIEIAPSVALQLNDYWSFGVSYRPAYTQVETKGGTFGFPTYLDSSVSGWDMKGLKAGFHLNQWHGFSAGLTYRLQTSQTLDGTAQFSSAVLSGEFDSSQHVHVPAQAQIGVAYDWIPETFLSTFAYEWTQNSVFNDNGLSVPTVEAALGVPTSTTLKWQDGHTFHFGSEYTWKLKHRKVRMGVGFILDKSFSHKELPTPGPAVDDDYYGYCWGLQLLQGSHTLGLAMNIGEYDQTTTTLDPQANAAAVFPGRYNFFLTTINADYQFRF